EKPASYEAWFLKTPNSRIGWQYILTNKTNFFDHFFRLGFNQNTGQLRYYTEQANNVRKAWVTDEDYANGKWHHVVATREEDKAQVYVDSVLVKEEEAMSGNLGGGETNWNIAQDGNTDGYLIGAVDEVRIYKKALTLEEIKQNFESQGLSVEPTAKLSLTWGRIKAAQSYR
ncbi:LamG domain-containing protein, partial [Candidatus Poribacteria bacterium]|nr:LamG domain-containing protein [Candidatus Poribacteria bacterium]